MAKDKEVEKSYKLEYNKRLYYRKFKRNSKNKQRHICESCHEEFKICLPLRKDPYYYEMSDKIILKRMCYDCYKDSAMCV